MFSRYDRNKNATPSGFAPPSLRRVAIADQLLDTHAENNFTLSMLVIIGRSC
jgi:hypothetical protein